MPIGPTELIIILVIIVVIFGAGRLSEVGGALGKGIKEFRSATNEEAAPAASTSPISIPPAVAANPCPACGVANRGGQSFCGQCGARMVHAG